MDMELGHNYFFSRCICQIMKFATMHRNAGRLLSSCTLVQMKTHDGEVYALFNKKFSSFALYEGIDGKDFTQYQVSARFSSRELDKKFVADLRSWLLNFEVNIGIIYSQLLCMFFFLSHVLHLT